LTYINNDNEEYPLWAEVFGFFLSSCSMAVIPGYALYHMFISKHDKLTPMEVG
jgi:hypothetical protein